MEYNELRHRVIELEKEIELIKKEIPRIYNCFARQYEPTQTHGLLGDNIVNSAYLCCVEEKIIDAWDVMVLDILAIGYDANGRLLVYALVPNNWLLLIYIFSIFHAWSFINKYIHYL